MTSVEAIRQLDVDSLLEPTAINDALALAVEFAGGAGAVYVHPDRDVFIVLGRAMFATVEPTSDDKRALYEIRLARYHDAHAGSMGARLMLDGYEEMGCG